MPENRVRHLTLQAGAHPPHDSRRADTALPRFARLKRQIRRTLQWFIFETAGGGFEVSGGVTQSVGVLVLGHTLACQRHRIPNSTFGMPRACPVDRYA
jgi:hypothetical protein